VSLNKIEPEYDGQWQGIMAASDGACYFGSSTHSYRHGAGFFRFDPVSKQLTVLAEDMTVVCGEDLTRTPPQGKIHSPIVESDGWLYFTTHLSNYWEEAKNAFTGAHVIGYEMATGRFRDFGIVRPRYTVYSAINVDPIGKKLYVFSVPFASEDVKSGGCHLYKVDVPTGEKQDLGRVVQKGQGASFWFFVDQKGDCWFTIWRKHGIYPEGGQGNLYRVLADTGKIERYDNVLPDCRLAPNGEPVPEDQLIDRSWTWAEALPGRARCLFTMGRLAGEDERLWIFDPSKNIEAGEAFQPVGFVGPTFLPVALGKDRVFYIQRGDLVSERGWSAEGERDKDPATAPPEDLHLKSISLDPKAHGAVIDHGEIVDQDGRTPRHIDSLAADQEGRVYMVGSWHILSGEQGTRQMVWDKPTREFHAMKRGQYFACADVSQDLE
jgi:sugar lactone lactonase YvrE